MIWRWRRFDTFCIFQSSANLDPVNRILVQIWYFSWLKKVVPPCFDNEKKSLSKACQQRVQGIKVSTVRRRTDTTVTRPNHAHDSDKKNGPIEMMELLKLDPKRKILLTTEMDLDVSSFLVYCYRKRIENQTMKNRAFVLPLSPSCPPQRIWRGHLLKEHLQRLSQKVRSKIGPEGFLQTSFDATRKITQLISPRSIYPFLPVPFLKTKISWDCPLPITMLRDGKSIISGWSDGKAQTILKISWYCRGSFNGTYIVGKSKNTNL